MSNTKNNARRRASRERIVLAFIELIEAHDIDQISVTEICQRAKVNRATFYANYEDIYDLGDTIKRDLENQTMSLYGTRGVSVGVPEDNYLGLLKNVHDHQALYRTYFKLCRNTELAKLEFADADKRNNDFGELADYHRMYHRAGITAIIKMWLSTGCKEPPEEIANLLEKELKPTSATR